MTALTGIDVRSARIFPDTHTRPPSYGHLSFPRYKSPSPFPTLISNHLSLSRNSLTLCALLRVQGCAHGDHSFRWPKAWNRWSTQEGSIFVSPIRFQSFYSLHVVFKLHLLRFIDQLVFLSWNCATLIRVWASCSIWIQYLRNIFQNLYLVEILIESDLIYGYEGKSCRTCLKF